MLVFPYACQLQVNSSGEFCLTNDNMLISRVANCLLY